MVIKNKKILITAGPTWVPIDRVRVISNIATGSTGILLAERLQKLGAKVTLALGPVPNKLRPVPKKVRVIRFVFFDDLKDIVSKQLRTSKYDIMIHTAAVSDYKPAKVYQNKVKSNMNNWKLNLVPTEKIINAIKKIGRDIFLVGFKFEPKIDKNTLIKKAKSLITKANLDLAVANTINNGKYRAYIVDRNKICGPLASRDSLVKKLINQLLVAEI